MMWLTCGGHANQILNSRKTIHSLQVSYGVSFVSIFNTLRPRQNGHHFADDTFKHIFLNEDVKISIIISLKFVPKGPVNNISSLVQRIAWRQPGDKPLFEPMMIRLSMHICVTRPQWGKVKWLCYDKED